MREKFLYIFSPPFSFDVDPCPTPKTPKVTWFLLPPIHPYFVPGPRPWPTPDLSYPSGRPTGAPPLGHRRGKGAALRLLGGLQLGARLFERLAGRRLSRAVAAAGGRVALGGWRSGARVGWPGSQVSRWRARKPNIVAWVLGGSLSGANSINKWDEENSKRARVVAREVDLLNLGGLLSLGSWCRGPWGKHVQRP